LLKAMLAEGLSDTEARSRFYVVDRDGLLVEGMSGLLDFQAPFAQARERVAQWHLDAPDRIGLTDVARNAHPTVLIGVSGQPGGFPEQVVRTMAEFAQQPIIFPLSNPTSRCEAAPGDLLAWTQGRAVIGTGSPFPPVLKDGVSFRVDQTNNAYVFPGIGLGSISAQARRISDGMLMAAARALAEASPSRRDRKANLLPPVTQLREVSYRVAVALALQAQAEGLAEERSPVENEARIRAKMWTPIYRPYRRIFD
jgi:malate dehydrogenase (oxaloacetate-decarboxylating)